MLVFRKQGPWTVQLYWPTITYQKANKRIYFNLPTSLAIGADLFAIEILGFGIGVMK